MFMHAFNPQLDIQQKSNVLLYVLHRKASKLKPNSLVFFFFSRSGALITVSVSNKRPGVEMKAAAATLLLTSGKHSGSR